MTDKRQRFFTDEFELGDVVSITRTRPGWLNGNVGGPIIELNPTSCVVAGEDGYEYEINHCRDINFDYRPEKK